MSVKRMVTGLRSPSAWAEAARNFSCSAEGADRCSADNLSCAAEVCRSVPQLRQNNASSETGAWQFGQTDSSGWPHRSQNLEPSKFSKEHWRHFTIATAFHVVLPFQCGSITMSFRLNLPSALYFMPLTHGFNNPATGPP